MSGKNKDAEKRAVPVEKKVKRRRWKEGRKRRRNEGRKLKKAETIKKRQGKKKGTEMCYVQVSGAKNLFHMH